MLILKLRIMKIFCSLLLLLCSFSPVLANNSSYKSSPKHQWHFFEPSSHLKAKQFTNPKALLKLKATDDLSLTSQYTDKSGHTHYKYVQKHQGILVEGSAFLLHEKNGQVKTAHGFVIADLNLNTKPNISAVEALQFALADLGGKVYAWEVNQYESTLQQIKGDDRATFYPNGELVIINPAANNEAKDYRLAYQFDIYALEPLFRKRVYVDAHSGLILSTINQMHQCNHSAASGNTNYSGQVNFNTCFNNGLYTLKSELDCPIQVFNAGQTKNYPLVAYQNTNNQFNQNPSAVEVFWTTRNAYEYFLTTFDQAGFGNNNTPIHSWVNYGTNFNNAFWNGTWLTFGNGDGQSYGSFTSPDIIAHEYMHGIIDHSDMPLAYYGESGALNESFADIFGEVIEHEMFGSNDWIIGADLVIEPGKVGLRSLEDPTSIFMMNQQPDVYEGHYWYDGFGDNKGVHINSGVQNHWFYLLSEGGSISNYFDDYFEIQGIGIEKAAAIAYKNLKDYLLPNASYFDAYLGSIEAAKDLFGFDSNEVMQVKNAWCAVNVGNNCVPLSSNKACNRNTDSLALVALYNSTNGANWTNNWDLTQPMNTWDRVFLNSKGCVKWLWLQNNNLTGNIPAQLGNLSNIIDLNLSSNNLTGNIPTQLGNLSCLKKLILTNNNLSGIIPLQLSALSKLNFLDLSSNNLNGAIPFQLNQLGDLLRLSLSNNTLTGALPDLSYLQNLLEFAASNNNLSGSIPSGFANLISLERMTINNSGLSGCYPGNLVSVCSHLFSTYNNNDNVSKDNNFDANWENFCLNGSGSCNNQSPIGPVYPGDFNQNGLVEVSDLLYWGLAVGETGAERPNASTSWSEQDCPEWQNMVDGVNSKHQDGNGDGIVNQQDINVLMQNYGLGTLNISPNSNSGSPVQYILDPMSTNKSGDEITLTYDLNINNQNGGLLEVHGIAGSIDLGDLPVKDIRADISDSSIEAEEFLIMHNEQSNTVDLAVTRTNQTNKSSSGSLARIIVIIEDISIGTSFSIKTNGGNIITANGTLNQMGGSTTYGSFNPNNNFTQDLSVFVTTQNENCSGLGKADLSVTNGTPPFNYQWSNGASTSKIDNLASGDYSVTVTDVNGLMAQIDFKINGQLPVFDEDSNIECGGNCSYYLEADNYLNSGIYQAENTLNSKAIISKRDNVEFKAGESIILENGFSIDADSNFSADIENCE